MELGRGVLKQDAGGQWMWKMDPVHIERRGKRGAPVRPVLWPALEKLRCPALAIWGMDSDVLSEAQARRMARTLPNGQLVPVPGVGHAPILGKPAALSAIEQVLGGSFVFGAAVVASGSHPATVNESHDRSGGGTDELIK